MRATTASAERDRLNTASVRGTRSGNRPRVCGSMTPSPARIPWPGCRDARPVDGPGRCHHRPPHRRDWPLGAVGQVHRPAEYARGRVVRVTLELADKLHQLGIGEQFTNTGGGEQTRRRSEIRDCGGRRRAGSANAGSRSRTAGSGRSRSRRRIPIRGAPPAPRDAGRRGNVVGALADCIDEYRRSRRHGQLVVPPSAIPRQSNPGPRFALEAGTLTRAEIPSGRTVSASPTDGGLRQQVAGHLQVSQHEASATAGSTGMALTSGIPERGVRILETVTGHGAHDGAARSIQPSAWAAKQARHAGGRGRFDEHAFLARDQPVGLSSFSSVAARNWPAFDSSWRRPPDSSSPAIRCGSRERWSPDSSPVHRSSTTRRTRGLRPASAAEVADAVGVICGRPFQ